MSHAGNDPWLGYRGHAPDESEAKRMFQDAGQQLAKSNPPPLAWLIPSPTYPTGCFSLPSREGRGGVLLVCRWPGEPTRSEGEGEALGD